MKFDEYQLSAANKIYELLEDDESRWIYKHRLLYSLTGDRRYIYDMISPLVTDHRSEILTQSASAGRDYHLYENRDLYSFLVEKKESSNGRIILFGSGFFGRQVRYWLEKVGFNVNAFCDNDLKKKGTVIDGIRVISPGELLKDETGSVVVVSSEIYYNEIYGQLLDLGVNKELIYKYEPNMLLSYFGIPYFDSGIIKPLKDEVFVDGGAYCGETAFEFSEWCPEYKAVYSFEPEKLNFLNLEKAVSDRGLRDIRCIQGGLWDKEETVSFDRGGDEGTGSYVVESGSEKIKTFTIDSFLSGKKITYIKLDIEGVELRALKGAQKTIKDHKPRLAVCIYHKPEDIIELPMYLHELVPEYRFVIRHYTTYLFDTVLYASL